MAYRDGVAVGRIMGISMENTMNRWERRQRAFFNLDCINDQEVAHRLIAQLNRGQDQNESTK